MKLLKSHTCCICEKVTTNIGLVFTEYKGDPYICGVCVFQTIVCAHKGNDFFLHNCPFELKEEEKKDD